MGLLDLFAALGDPLLDAPPSAAKDLPALRNRSKKKAASTGVSPPASPGTPRKPSPTYWRPLALVLLTPTWRCTCGAAGHDRPQLFLREQHGPDGGKFTQLRLRAIGDSLVAYPNLHLEVEEAEPTIIRHCAQCTPAVFRHPQLSLPLDLPPPPAPLYHRTPMEALFDEYEEMRIAANSARALL